MSSKRYLLILLLLGSMVGLLAQPRLSMDAGLYLDDELELKARNRISATGSFGQGWNWELQSDLHRSRGQSAAQLEELTHAGKAELGYQSGLGTYRLGYTHSVFGESSLLGLYPAWMPALNYKRLMAHQASFSSHNAYDDWSLDAYGIYRHLRVEPYSFDFGDFQFHPQDPEGYSDAFGGAKLSWDASNAVKIYTAMEIKAGFHAEEDPYDYSTVTLGCEGLYKPLPQGRLEGSVQISHRDGDAIDAPKANLVRARLRYQHTFMPGLSGFITWENNTCFADSLSALYLISNYLRPQLVYTLDYDPSGMSYLRLGGKYSPENEASAVFGDGEARLWKGLYASLGAGLIPERLEQYSSALLYRFSSSELGIRYLHREFIIYPGKTDYWGVETRLYW